MELCPPNARPSSADPSTSGPIPSYACYSSPCNVSGDNRCPPAGAGREGYGASNSGTSSARSGSKSGDCESDAKARRGSHPPPPGGAPTTAAHLVRGGGAAEHSNDPEQHDVPIVHEEKDAGPYRRPPVTPDALQDSQERAGAGALPSVAFRTSSPHEFMAFNGPLEALSPAVLERILYFTALEDLMTLPFISRRMLQRLPLHSPTFWWRRWRDEVCSANGLGALLVDPELVDRMENRDRNAAAATAPAPFVYGNTNTSHRPSAPALPSLNSSAAAAAGIGGSRGPFGGSGSHTPGIVGPTGGGWAAETVYRSILSSSIATPSRPGLPPGGKAADDDDEEEGGEGEGRACRSDYQTDDVFANSSTVMQQQQHAMAPYSEGIAVFTWISPPSVCTPAAEASGLEDEDGATASYMKHANRDGGVGSLFAKYQKQLRQPGHRPRPFMPPIPMCPLFIWASADPPPAVVQQRCRLEAAGAVAGASTSFVLHDVSSGDQLGLHSGRTLASLTVDGISGSAYPWGEWASSEHSTLFTPNATNSAAGNSSTLTTGEGQTSQAQAQAGSAPQRELSGLHHPNAARHTHASISGAYPDPPPRYGNRPSVASTATTVQSTSASTDGHLPVFHGWDASPSPRQRCPPAAAAAAAAAAPAIDLPAVAASTTAYVRRAKTKPLYLRHLFESFCPNPEEDELAEVEAEAEAERRQQHRHDTFNDPCASTPPLSPNFHPHAFLAAASDSGLALAGRSHPPGGLVVVRREEGGRNDAEETSQSPLRRHRDRRTSDTTSRSSSLLPARRGPVTHHSRRSHTKSSPCTRQQHSRHAHHHHHRHHHREASDLRLSPHAKGRITMAQPPSASAYRDLPGLRVDHRDVRAAGPNGPFPGQRSFLDPVTPPCVRRPKGYKRRQLVHLSVQQFRRAMDYLHRWQRAQQLVALGGLMTRASGWRDADTASCGAGSDVTRRPTGVGATPPSTVEGAPSTALGGVSVSSACASVPWGSSGATFGVGTSQRMLHAAASGPVQRGTPGKHKMLLGGLPSSVSAYGGSEPYSSGGRPPAREDGLSPPRDLYDQPHQQEDSSPLSLPSSSGGWPTPCSTPRHDRSPQSHGRPHPHAAGGERVQLLVPPARPANERRRYPVGGEGALASAATSALSVGTAETVSVTSLPPASTLGGAPSTQWFCPRGGGFPAFSSSSSDGTLPSRSSSHHAMRRQQPPALAPPAGCRGAAYPGMPPRSIPTSPLYPLPAVPRSAHSPLPYAHTQAPTLHRQGKEDASVIHHDDAPQGAGRVEGASGSLVVQGPVTDWNEQQQQVFVSSPVPFPTPAGWRAWTQPRCWSVMGPQMDHITYSGAPTLPPPLWAFHVLVHRSVRLFWRSGHLLCFLTAEDRHDLLAEDQLCTDDDNEEEDEEIEFELEGREGGGGSTSSASGSTSRPLLLQPLFRRHANDALTRLQQQRRYAASRGTTLTSASITSSTADAAPGQPNSRHPSQYAPLQGQSHMINAATNTTAVSPRKHFHTPNCRSCPCSLYDWIHVYTPQQRERQMDLAYTQSSLPSSDAMTRRIQQAAGGGAVRGSDYNNNNNSFGQRSAASHGDGAATTSALTSVASPVPPCAGILFPIAMPPAPASQHHLQLQPSGPAAGAHTTPVSPVSAPRGGGGGSKQQQNWAGTRSGPGLSSSTHRHCRRRCRQHIAAVATPQSAVWYMAQVVHWTGGKVAAGGNSYAYPSAVLLYPPHHVALYLGLLRFTSVLKLQQARGETEDRYLVHTKVLSPVSGRSAILSFFFRHRHVGCPLMWLKMELLLTRGELLGLQREEEEERQWIQRQQQRRRCGSGEMTKRREEDAESASTGNSTRSRRQDSPEQQQQQQPRDPRVPGCPAGFFSPSPHSGSGSGSRSISTSCDGDSSSSASSSLETSSESSSSSRPAWRRGGRRSGAWADRVSAGGTPSEKALTEEDAEEERVLLFQGGMGRVEVDVAPQVDRRGLVLLAQLLSLPPSFSTALLWNAVVYASMLGVEVWDQFGGSFFATYRHTFTDVVSKIMRQEEQEEQEEEEMEEPVSER